MVDNSSLEKKEIVSFVKRLRTEYLIKHTDLACEKAFIPLQNIVNNFENLSKIIGDNNTEEKNRYMSRSNIKFGAEMFIFLNSCPSLYIKLYWNAMYGIESRMAEFASNIIRKAKDNFKVKAQKIFAKISSVLGFQHNSYHYEGNEVIGTNKVFDIEGETHENWA